MAKTYIPETDGSSQGKEKTGDSDRLESLFLIMREEQLLTDQDCSCISSWRESVLLPLSYINCRLLSGNTQLFINAQSQLLFLASLCYAASSLPPCAIIQYFLKKSYPFVIIWEQSLKPLVKPWPCNWWLLIWASHMSTLPLLYVALMCWATGYNPVLPGILFVSCFLCRIVVFYSVGLHLGTLSPPPYTTITIGWTAIGSSYAARDLPQKTKRFSFWLL